jgi:glycosyltransferase involved in cell wall biosynthesis
VKSLQILYSASPLGGASSGMRTFNDGLAPALARALGERGHVMTMLCTRASVEDFRRKGIRTIEAAGEGVLYENLWLPYALRRIRPDVVYFPSSRMPFLFPKGIPAVATIHDLLFWRYSAQMRPTKRIFRLFATRAVLRNATTVLANSEFTRDEIVAFGYCGRMEVVRPGIVPPERSDDTGAFTGASLPLVQRRKPFFLFLGSQTFQKNLPTLVRAFALFCGRERSGSLVIAGPESTGTAALRAALAELNGDEFDRITVLGQVSAEEREALYSHALCFVFPSFYEGFGFPILEAFAHGLPVIHSTAGALQEVAGGAGLLSDPGEQALCEEMHRVYRDPELRKSLIEAGYERVKCFSWEMAAQRICSVLEDVSGRAAQVPGSMA